MFYDEWMRIRFGVKKEVNPKVLELLKEINENI